MIDLVGLRALIAIADHGSVIGAAGALGFTPSAVSQQVKRLEHETRVELVERVGRGIALTEAARQLVEDGRGLFGQVEILTSRLELVSGAGYGGLRLVAFATAVRGLVAPVLTELARDLPELSITVIERDPVDAVAMVAGGQADLAVVHDYVGVPLHRPPGIESVLIGTDRVDVLLPVGHRLADRPVVTAAELADETWASTPVNSICHDWFIQMYAGEPRLPQVRFWGWEHASHVELVRAGVAVSLLPRLGRQLLPAGVVTVPVTDPVPTRALQVLFRSTMATSVAVREVVDRLAEVARGLGSPPV